MCIQRVRYLAYPREIEGNSRLPAQFGDLCKGGLYLVATPEATGQKRVEIDTPVRNIRVKLKRQPANDVRLPGFQLRQRLSQPRESEITERAGEVAGEFDMKCVGGGQFHRVGQVVSQSDFHRQ